MRKLARLTGLNAERLARDGQAARAANDAFKCYYIGGKIKRCNKVCNAKGPLTHPKQLAQLNSNFKSDHFELYVTSASPLVLQVYVPNKLDSWFVCWRRERESESVGATGLTLENYVLRP